MIIDLSTINFVGGGGESSAPAGKVENVEVNIEMNGVENPTLNEGFSAFGGVTVNSDNVTNSSALLFTQLNYDEELNTELNAKYNADIQYSKELLDKWNEGNNTNFLGEISRFQKDTKLIYCPKVDTSNVTNTKNMFNGCTKLQFIPLLNTSNVTSMYNMFNGCSSLINVPLFNTSNVTDTSYMFSNCSNLTTIPLFNTSNVTDTSYMFSGCNSLINVPLFNTSNVTNMKNMFMYCSNLTTIPLIDTSNVTNMNSIFYSCETLTSLPLLDCGKVTNINGMFGYYDMNNLTELGGFKNLKIDWNDSTGLVKCTKLTYQSVMNVLNNLYDFRANGDMSTTRTIKLNSNSYNLLTADDIALCNNKGWNITY